MSTNDRDDLLEPEEWLLLLVALADQGRGLDPVRIQKGCFLLAREAGLEPSERYEFIPYNYGPMSAGAYRGVASLLASGELDAIAVPGYGWSRYRPTAAGSRRAGELAARVSRRRPRALAELRRIGAEIAGADFGELLADVYKRYPRFAARSVFRPR